MNFDDTPQEAEFRETARKWIEANAPKQYEAELSKSSLGRIRLEKEEIVDVGKAWQKKKAEGGWACLHWPKEYGGRGAELGFLRGVIEIHGGFLSLSFRGAHQREPGISFNNYWIPRCAIAHLRFAAFAAPRNDESLTPVPWSVSC